MIATVAAAVASGLAYVNVFDELMKASERWGVKVWATPDDSLGALFSGGSLLVGGSVFLASLVLLGWVRLHQRRNAFVLQVTALAAVPLAAALISGVAGQPRSYFYLLPAVVVCAAAWVIDQQARVRHAGAILFLVGIAVFGWQQLRPSSASHGYGALAEAFANRPSRDILVAPLFLEIPLDFYTRDSELAKLLTVLTEGELDALLFPISDSDPRAGFASYNLFDDDTLFEVTLPEASFEEFYRREDMRLLGLTDGRRLYPGVEIEWEVVQGQAGLRLAESAFGPLPSIGFLSAERDFVAFESTGFAVPREGMVAIVFAHRGGHVVATLCEDSGEVWRPQTAYRGQAIELTAIDARGVTWSLQSRLVPVRPDQRYAVCITGKGSGDRYVADLLYTYFPLPE